MKPEHGTVITLSAKDVFFFPFFTYHLAMEIPVLNFILSLEIPGLTQGRHFQENWVRTLKRRYGLHIFVRVNDVYHFFFHFGGHKRLWPQNGVNTGTDPL